MTFDDGAISPVAYPLKMRRIVIGIVISLGAIGLAFGTLAACSLPTGVESGNILTEKLPADVTPDGVLLAAVILSSGNIEVAVTQGIVSSAEVSEARDSILANTLKLWKQRAESEVAVATK